MYLCYSRFGDKNLPHWTWFAFGGQKAGPPKGKPLYFILCSWLFLGEGWGPGQGVVTVVKVLQASDKNKTLCVSTLLNMLFNEQELLWCVLFCKYLPPNPDGLIQSGLWIRTKLYFHVWQFDMLTYARGKLEGVWEWECLCFITHLLWGLMPTYKKEEHFTTQCAGEE